MSGGVSGILNTVTGGIFGSGGSSSAPTINVTPAQDTAQQETDTAQKATNAALSRKKSRSLLSTGANSTDSGSSKVALAAKKLLGE